MSALFLKGLSFGFVLAATVGPMWVLCLRRTLAYGAAIGFASGMGIAVADGIYGAVAAFGLTAVSGFLLQYSFWIGLTGAASLVYLGIRTLLAKPAAMGEGLRPTSLAQAFLSTLGLTLANPLTILAFAAIFAGLGLAATPTTRRRRWSRWACSSVRPPGRSCSPRAPARCAAGWGRGYCVP